MAPRRLDRARPPARRRLKLCAGRPDSEGGEDEPNETACRSLRSHLARRVERAQAVVGEFVDIEVAADLSVRGRFGDEIGDELMDLLGGCVGRSVGSVQEGC